MSEEEKEVVIYSEEEWQKITEQINKLKEQKKAIQKYRKNEYCKKYIKEHKEQVNKRLAENKSKLTEEEKEAIRQKTNQYRKEWYKTHANKQAESSSKYRKKVFEAYKLLKELYTVNFKVTQEHIDKLKDIYNK